MRIRYQVQELSQTTAKVDDPELIKIIYESHKKYPRKYLIEEKKNSGVSDPTILKWLRDITSVKGLTVDMMRSSYITDFYEKNKTFGKRKELAAKMRHSVMTASRNYLKVEDTPMDLRFEKLDKSNWGGAIFAQAGLERINLLKNKFEVLDWMIPAPGQGTMCVVNLKKNKVC